MLRSFCQLLSGCGKVVRSFQKVVTTFFWWGGGGGNDRTAGNNGLVTGSERAMAGGLRGSGGE